MDNLAELSKFTVMISCIILLSSCTTKQFPVSDWHKEAIVMSKSDQKELFKKINDETANLMTLKALLKVTGQKSLGKQQFIQSLIFQKPDRLRIDTFSPGFGQLLGLFTANKQTISIYDAAKNKTSSAPTSKRSLGEVLGFPLEIDQIPLLMLGQTSVSKDCNARYHLKNDSYLIYCQDEEYWQMNYVVIDINDQHFLEYTEIGSIKDKKTLAEVQILKDGESFPKKLLITLPDKGIKLEITPKKIIKNAKLRSPETLFKIHGLM